MKKYTTPTAEPIFLDIDEDISSQGDLGVVSSPFTTNTEDDE